MRMCCDSPWDIITRRINPSIHFFYQLLIPSQLALKAPGSNKQMVLDPWKPGTLQGRQIIGRKKNFKKVCCCQGVGGRESREPKLHWFVLKAELTTGPYPKVILLMLNTGFSSFSFTFLKDWPEHLQHTLDLVFSALINTPPTSVLLSVPVLLAFLCPSEENSEWRAGAFWMFPY